MALMAVAAVSVANEAFAKSRWENHVDASLIREIVYHDGELFMATVGGILVYTPDTGQFDQYQNTRGLPSNALNCLVFDDAGDMWIGTQDVGIARVTLGPDGLDVRRFSSLGLANIHITSIDIWEGEIVYGTIEGAGKFENGFPVHEFYYGSDEGLPSNVIHDVFTDGDYVWFATAAGATVLSRDPIGSFVFTEVQGGPPMARVVEKSDDSIWLATNSGVWRMALSDSSWTQTGPSGVDIYSLHWDGQKMWAGGTTAFYEYDSTGQQWQEHVIKQFYGLYGMPQEDSGGKGLVRAITRTNNGDVYVAAAKEGSAYGINLVRYDGQQMDNLLPNDPGENRIVRLARDVDGSIWVTCNGLGVGKLMPSGLWVNYNTSVPGAGQLSGLFSNRAILADSEGRKWFTTQTVDEDDPKPLDELDDKLDEVYGNDVWTRHPLGSGIGDAYGTLRAQRAVEDPAGNRWFLADEADPAYNLPPDWNGIHILRQDTQNGYEWLKVQPATTGNRMMGGYVSHVAFDFGVVYVAIHNKGVQSWETGGYDWASLSDLANSVWGNTLNASLDVELSEATKVFSLALRKSDRVLWIGTDVGVYKYDPLSSFRYKLIRQRTGSEVGLLGLPVLFVLLDHQENLWVATKLGLNKISREDDNDIEAYTTAAGFQELVGQGVNYGADVISPLAGAVCVDLLLHPDRDLLYIGTRGGLSIFDITPVPQVPTDLDNVYLYPNPVDQSRGHDVLRIDNVELPVSIDIYNLEGNLIHSATVTESEQEVWDLTTQSAFIVASGVYFVRIDNGESTIVKTVTVIR
jgi:ligand-binding sensor domain-containing protein